MIVQEAPALVVATARGEVSHLIEEVAVRPSVGSSGAARAEAAPPIEEQGSPSRAHDSINTTPSDWLTT